ncbi:MAG: hypothetical protein Q8Q03_01815, partial [bacterium]|nr:hypothetical protein [bacterium]
ALTIRNAQSYGLNVKSKPVSGGASFSSEFTYPYGVRFDRTSLNKATKVVFFVDANLNGAYDAPGEEISTSNIKRGSKVSALCVGSGSCTISNVNTLDITFKRPDPNAIIKINGNTVTTYTYAEITLVSTDGGVKKVSVRSTGQINVCDNNNVCN